MLALFGMIVAGLVFYMFSNFTDTTLSSSVNNSNNENDRNEQVEMNENEPNLQDDNDESNANNENDEPVNESNESNENENQNDSEELERVFFMNDNYFYIDRSGHEDAINYQQGKEQEAKQLIDYLHQTMNDIVGYGNVESLNFDNLRDGKYHDNNRFHNSILKLQEELLDDSRALHDIRNLENFYQLGSSLHSEDRMALRYAHRVIHDLDIYVNGAGDDDDRKIWGLTEAYGNDNAIESMYDYLREYGESN